MKTELDRLMRERHLDALWITGAGNHNPALVYFTGVANLTHADLIKKRDEPPVLFHYPMEREEAARTGLACRNLNTYRLQALLQQAGGNQARAAAMRLAAMFRDLGVRGRVGLAGTSDLANLYPVIVELAKQAPDITLDAAGDEPILLAVRATKSPEELARIRAVGRISTSVIGETAEFITGHAVHKDRVVHSDGRPLTIGQVKSFIQMRLAAAGAEMPEGLIFAQGRDAAIPHSTGNDKETLRLGRTIVFDFFPCELGGGFFYDITRTWCLGYAPDEAAALYDQVRQAHRQAMQLARPGIPCKDLQTETCRLFARLGHPTVLENPQTEKGYVHNLGHGVGLNIHESPSFVTIPTNLDTLLPGAVFTIEPGLYYPERGMGVRIEDTVTLGQDGKPKVLASYPYDLVLPMKRSARGSHPARAAKRK
jgi:Xaa-Pro aminopeptidase